MTRYPNFFVDFISQKFPWRSSFTFEGNILRTTIGKVCATLKKKLLQGEPSLKKEFLADPT